MEEHDAKDMSGVILQGFLDEGNVEKVVEVVDQLHHRFGTSEPVNGPNFGLIIGGIVVGAGLGATAGYIFAQKRLEEKYNQISAEEIAEAREKLYAHFNSKELARENEQTKGELKDVIRERGYAPEPEEETTPPMAITPPSTIVEAAEEAKEEAQDGVETPPPVDEEPEPVVRNIFQDNPPPEDEWDWHKERSQRSPMRPYVIHREERDENEAYDGVTYTYYEQDDVVCDERDEVLSPERREHIIGEANLEKFGHGSGDATTVYVRNDQLEMDIEVIRSPNSYAEEVHGLEPEIRHSDRRRGGRIRIDDE